MVPGDFVKTYEAQLWSADCRVVVLVIFAALTQILVTSIVDASRLEGRASDASMPLDWSMEYVKYVLKQTCKHQDRGLNCQTMVATNGSFRRSCLK